MSKGEKIPTGSAGPLWITLIDAPHEDFLFHLITHHDLLERWGNAQQRKDSVSKREG